MATQVGYHGKMGSHGNVAQPAGHGSKPTHEGSRNLEQGDEDSSHASVKQLASVWSPKGLSFLINVVMSFLLAPDKKPNSDEYFVLVNPL